MAALFTATTDFFEAKLKKQNRLTSPTNGGTFYVF